MRIGGSGGRKKKAETGVALVTTEDRGPLATPKLLFETPLPRAKGGDRSSREGQTTTPVKLGGGKEDKTRTKNESNHHVPNPNGNGDGQSRS